MKHFSLFSVIVLLGFSMSMAFISCDPDGGTTTYTVTIGTLSNGSITASPTSGVEGTEITLTVTPASGYRLKFGTLKHGTTTINESTFKFNLPDEDVTVVAEFEASLLPSTVGELIITGIPASENGKYACLRAAIEGPSEVPVQLFGMANALVEGEFIGVEIKNGSVTIPIYVVNGSTVDSYGGSGSFTTFIVTKATSTFTVVGEVSSGGHQITPSITFTNGKATADW
jgi:hypothetical protein